MGLAGVKFQAIQAGEDAGASDDEAMDQDGISDGDDSAEGSDGPNLYEEGNDVRGCSSCQTPGTIGASLKSVCTNQVAHRATDALQKTSLLPAVLL